ncbi:putative MscS family protein.1 [Pseudoalteromonas holothuriae]|uniref:MscS family protein.1 n=1 Tax=Pseudoalteromonas holothuriae TaxID=2963714 RepID=A0A9W4QS06_9GAMM|nr:MULTISPECIES: mechanosensitive ion channel domain-containing protein [unclassified Pseudoalteromonas]CAH9050633.1 putative MscS family protein.1 [Pseudoalteromonas sp. CIP111854]CAH9059625.1 putative MscS family protein.1 [Pseudoalteromonas sp. CIP111951]
MDMSWLNRELFKMGEFTLLVGEVLSFFIVLLITFIISRILRAAFGRVAKRQGVIENTSAYVIGRLIHYVVLFIGFIVALTSLGMEMTELALVASALGVGIGLGLQGLVNNFVSGLVLLLEKTVKVGDFVELSNGVVGQVMAIYMRATLIRTNDNVDILIPNAELVSGLVTNWTLAEKVRRFRIPFSVAYGSDKEQVKLAVLEAADKVPYTLSSFGREPTVWMTGFGDSSLNFTLGVWVQPEQVKRPTALVSDYLWAIDDAFRKYDIEIPFPQRDIHIRTPSSKVNYVE